MADQKLKVNLDADAQPLIEALSATDEHLDNISQKADSANKSLEDMVAAGELAAEGIERTAAAVEIGNEKLDALNETAEAASGKLEDVKTATEATAQGVEKRREQAPRLCAMLCNMFEIRKI